MVEKYQQAFGSGDVQTARSLLADDLHFKGPIEEFDNAERLHPVGGKARTNRDGHGREEGGRAWRDVVTIYDLHTKTPAGTSNVAEWATVKNGKIAEMRVFFDARPFAAMFEQHRRRAGCER